MSIPSQCKSNNFPTKGSVTLSKIASLALIIAITVAVTCKLFNSFPIAKANIEKPKPKPKINKQLLNIKVDKCELYKIKHKALPEASVLSAKARIRTRFKLMRLM